MKAILLCAFVSCLSVAARAASDPHLDSIRGVSLSDGATAEVHAGKKGLVVIFMSAVCPCSNSHVAILKSLSSRFPDFKFVAIHSNADEPIEKARAYFQSAGLPFPVLEDEHDHWANELLAFKTPHAFVFGSDGHLLYRGGVTNSVVGPKADRHFLEDALSDVSEGRPVRVAEGRTLGCAIAR